MPTVLLALVLFTAVQRLFEMRLSHRNLSLLRKQTESRGGVLWPGDSQTWFGAMVLLQVALLVATPLEAHFRNASIGSMQTTTALLLWCAGQILRFWSQKALGPAWNARGIVSSTQKIIHSGPYRYLRHPNYLGVVLEMIALPLAGSAWISLLCLNLLQAPILLHRMHCEERLLSRHSTYSRLPGRPFSK